MHRALCCTADTSSHNKCCGPQATDVRVSIKGGAAARAEVRERRDGAVEVTYTAPMSGEYRIALGVGAVVIGTYRAQCAPPRPSEALSRVRPSVLSQTSITSRPHPYRVAKKLACFMTVLSVSKVVPRLLQHRPASTQPLYLVSQSRRNAAM